MCVSVCLQLFGHQREAFDSICRCCVTPGQGGGPPRRYFGPSIIRAMEVSMAEKLRCHQSTRASATAGGVHGFLLGLLDVPGMVERTNQGLLGDVLYVR